MANIQKRKSKKGTVTYRALVRLKGHAPESATFKRLTDAKKWISSTESAIREGRYFKSNEARRRTLSDLVDRYVEKVLPQKPRSNYEQKYQLEWWKLQIGHLSLADVTPAVVAEQRDKLLSNPTKSGKQRANATVNRYLAALSHAFTIAVKEWNWLDENPLRAVSRPSEPRNRVRYLDKEQIQRLEQACLNSTNSFLRLIFVIAISTGMRRGEILNLTWDDVDVAKRTLILRETKNDEIRVVPIQGKALKLLIEHGKVRRLDSPLVFPSQRDSKKPTKIDTSFRKAVQEAEISDYHFHDNRHTAASYLAMNGASLNEIAAILGHKTLAMVQRYAHLSEDHTSAVVEKMNKNLFG